MKFRLFGRSSKKKKTATTPAQPQASTGQRKKTPELVAPEQMEASSTSSSSDKPIDIPTRPLQEKKTATTPVQPQASTGKRKKTPGLVAPEQAEASSKSSSGKPIDIPTRPLQDPNAVYKKRKCLEGMPQEELQTYLFVAHLFSNDAEKKWLQGEPEDLTREWENNMKKIPWLIQSGADILALHPPIYNDNPPKFNVLTAAAACGFTEALEFYFEHKDKGLCLNPFFPDGRGNYVIHYLARNSLKAADGNVPLLNEILNIGVKMIEPQANAQRTQEIKQKLIDLRNGLNGYNVLTSACFHDNLVMVKKLEEQNFTLDFFQLGKERNQGDIPAYSALSAALARNTSYDVLQYLVLERGFNVAAKPPAHAKDPLTPLERVGYTHDAKEMVDFLNRVRKYNGEPLCHAILEQMQTSDVPSIQEAYQRFCGLKEFTDLFRHRNTPG